MDEIRKGLYIKFHPLTELNRCYVVLETTERKFGTLSDWERVLENVAWTYPSSFVINVSERQMVQLEAGGSPHPVGVKRALRTTRSTQCLAILVDEEGSAAYLEVSMFPEEPSPHWRKLRANFKDKLTMAALRCWNHLEFWRL